MLDACEFSLCTKLNELDNACKKKRKRLFLFFYNCKFSPVEENPLGIPINIKVSKTHLCSVSDQFVTQRNGITKILLRTNLNVHKMLL